MAVTGSLDETKKGLLTWLKSAGPRKEPFQLCPWIYVLDPEKFHLSLVADMEAGPSGPRALTGAFFSELELYHKAMET
jgi:hypothetical protein